MRRPTQLRLFALLVLLFCRVCAQEVSAPASTEAPALTAKSVLKAMHRVGRWQMSSKIKEKPTDWQMGALYAGISALSLTTGSVEYENWFVEMCDRVSNWQLGRYRYYADDQCVGQAYLELYMRHRDPKMLADVKRQFDAILKNPPNHSLEFQTESARRDEWCWCDALFMAPPVWMRLYAATGNKAYMEFAVERWWKTSDYLYDKEEHLYFRDNTYFKDREANGRKIFWSRGNGWVMGGLVRVLQYLPADHSSRPRFEQQFREMAAALLACQGNDGMWRSSLLDPAHYPISESSGTGFYCYAFAYGVNEGLLPLEPYGSAAIKAWHGLVGCVTPQGKLTHAQPVGADPKKFDVTNSEIYAVGAFLLAGSEMYKLAQRAESTR
ncbi:MAG: glycoside hydrolase family 88 protein [Nibricoccus sp.]